MNCPHCLSRQTRKLILTTDLGYVRYQCRSCLRHFNERTGTPFNFLELPTNIVFQVVLSRLLFKLSLRDLVQMFLIRGYEFTYETVRDWETRFASLLADQVRRKRKGKVGRCWYVDETYLKVGGRWCYLYRAIDRNGQLIDSMLSQKRNMKAAQRFFRSAQTVAGSRPEQVTTDGHYSVSPGHRGSAGQESRPPTKVTIVQRGRDCKDQRASEHADQSAFVGDGRFPCGPERPSDDE